MSADVVVTEFITIDGVIQDPGGSREFERGAGASSTTAARRATGSSSTS
jgi:hypothetical protein